MNELIKKLHERKNQLDQSAFCNFLKDTNVPAKRRLSFAPSMFFFVLGFQDMLKVLYDENPTSEEQQIVNDHCEEDSTHWYWYLRDLKYLSKLSYVQYDGLIEQAHVIWGPENWETRSLVYEAIHNCKTVTSPFLKLVILQVLESTFESYNTGIRQVIAELDMFDELKYYGRLHGDAEEDHAYQDWLDLDPNDPSLKKDSVSDEERYHGLMIIDNLFDSFEAMFDNWLANVDTDSQKMIA